MSIDPVGAAAASSASSKAGQQLAGNFDTFLTLLTTQLQNQDPMSPMDSNQFTQQLVQFSGVEQQINTNKNMESLISLTQSRANTDALGFLGKSVTMSGGKGVLIDGAAKWTYGLDSKAKDNTITISNADGRVVYTTQGETTAGIHNFEWDGKDNMGNQLPNGEYRLSLNAQGVDGSPVISAIASKGVVGQIDFSGSEPKLMLGPMQIALSEVAALQN
ncbi:MAG TPA: flagellar hook assembly protein FlgD [Rhizomicrobium sp.]|nr:flagellar hook assembly protein FlgD [Rhizomicrobium sp.]